MSPNLFDYFVSENTLRKKHILHRADGSGSIWHSLERYTTETYHQTQYNKGEWDLVCGVNLRNYKKKKSLSRNNHLSKGFWKT